VGYLFGNIATNEIAKGLYICANTQSPPFYRSYDIWLPVVVYDGILCLLAVWHGVRSWMTGYRTGRSDGVNIADILVKGNAGYFLWCVHVHLGDNLYSEHDTSSHFLRQSITDMHCQYHRHTISRGMYPFLRSLYTTIT